MHRGVRFQPLTAVLAVALWGCAVQARSDPFSGGSSGRARGEAAVRVTLEVVCDACVISYSVGSVAGSAGQDRLNPVWSMRLVRYPSASEIVRLSATANGGSVHRARIFVDGEVAAVDDNDASRSRRTLCASTMIPRETGSDEPARSGCPERNGDASEGR